MALQEVAARVLFQGGVETKADPKGVPAVRLLALENAVFTRAVSLVKRSGYTSLGLAVLGAVAPYSLPRGLAARGDEIVLFTEAGPYSYVEGAAAWSAIGDGCQSIRQSDRALVKTTSSQTGCDYAVCDGVALTCWQDSRGGVYYALGDEGDKRITIPPTLASSTGSAPRAVRCGAKLALLWTEDASGAIKVIMFDPNAPQSFDDVTFPAVLADDLQLAAPYFDVAYTNGTDVGGTGAAAIAWNATSGIRVGWIDPSGVIGSGATSWPGALTEALGGAVTAGPAIAVDSGDSAQWAVAWAVGTAVTAVFVTSEGYQSTTPVSVAAAGADTAPDSIDRIAVGVRDVDGTSTLDLWTEARNSTAMLSIVRHSVYPFGGAIADAVPAQFRGACLASSAWTDGPDGGTERGYVTILHPAALFSTYLAVRDDGLVVAQSVPTNAGEPPGTALPRVTSNGDRVWQWAAVFRNRLPLEDGADVGSVYAENFTESGPRLVSLDFAAADAYQTAIAGRALYLGGAAPMAYDGAGFVEAAPYYAPDWAAGTVLHSQDSGGGLAAGTYSYVFWYEWALATGEIVRGPVSKPYEVTVTGGSDDRVVFGFDGSRPPPSETPTLPGGGTGAGIPTYRIGACGRDGGDREDCRIGVARSLVGDATVYYRCSSLDPSTVGTDNGYVANTQLDDFADFADVFPDSVLRLHEPIYTTGGIPSNDPIATSGVIAECGGRVFLGDASDADGLYFSQERAAGYAVELTPELRVSVPSGGGRVSGVADMDGAKIIFKAGAIYALTGSGPLANPSLGGDWSLPALITSDVGCVDQRSIVTTPVGLMFQSAKGIYLLDRGKNVSYIGAPVEAYNDLTIVRATLLEDANQVRFLTATTTLLYDYLFDQWSTFTNHGGVDAIVSAGVYHYLRADGRVFRQSSGYADDNLQIPMVIETAWVRFDSGSLQGLQRVWHAQILGTWKSAHRLFVQYMTDYDTDGNWSDPLPADGHDATDMGGGAYGAGSYGDGIYGGESAAPYQFSVHVGAKCQAIRFRFTFVEAVGTFGACAELTELKLTGGVKGNRNKIPAARMA